MRLALCGGRELNLAAAIQAILADLELLYEALDVSGEKWASGSVHMLQCRLRALAELATLAGAGPLTPSRAAYRRV